MTYRSASSLRRFAAAGTVTLGLLVTAACQPAPPPATFTVNATALAHDAVPGDGACEATPDVGDCTLNAAIDEANALGRGVVVLEPTADGDTYGILDTSITGHITIRVDQADVTRTFAEVGPAHIHVATGGSLVSEAIAYPFGDLSVDGTFVASRLSMVGILRVEPGGQALLVNAFIRPGPEPAVTNRGSLSLRYSTIAVTHDGATGIETTGTGVTHLGGTAFTTSPDATGTSACTGNLPESDGYNAAADTTCSLTGVGDLQGWDGATDPGPFPSPGSPLRDAIAAGTLGCGTNVRTDIRGGVDVRPNDGDGDGIAACDIGAWEA